MGKKFSLFFLALAVVGAAAALLLWAFDKPVVPDYWHLWWFHIYSILFWLMAYIADYWKEQARG